MQQDYSYEYGKVIAFVKCEINGAPRFFWFVLNRNQSFTEFLTGILNPYSYKPGWSITPMNYRYTAFHVKVKGSKEFTMAGNPEYLISHSLKKGFFNKNAIAA
jgi:hypothetical protein